MSIDTNLIYRGDCYSVLKRYFPTGNDEEGIDLIYIDPPFSFDPKYAKLWYDKESLEMFEEMRKGNVKHYISWMSKRLEQCHRVLKNTGSIYLHCDWKFGHYLKVEMDNIFGRKNFQREIIWKVGWVSGFKSKTKNWIRNHDNILFYSKGKDFTFNKLYVPHPKGYKRRGGGKNPKGIPIDDVWTDIYSIQHLSFSKEKTGYPTQKSEALLERIIKASSNPDDIILDPMCGCGTTIATAHKLERKWIGIDISSQGCGEMKKRMEKLEDIAEVEVRGLPLCIKDLKKLSHFEFQDYICEMTNSEKTKHVADEGIDGYHLGEIPLQTKQQERIGRNVIDNFETALRRKNKNKGYIIGFSFTKNAYEEAARAKLNDNLNISLINVNELIKRDYELEDLIE